MNSLLQPIKPLGGDASVTYARVAGLSLDLQTDASLETCRRRARPTWPNLRNLRRMLRVIDAGSLTEVGESVGRTQQTISHSIQALELELGVRLFDRTSLGARPTREALALGTRVRRALAHLAIVREKFAESLDGHGWSAQRLWDFNISNQHVFIFLSLCELQDCKLTAAELDLDVSAVRKAIRALQMDLRCPLFERSARGALQPTELAELLARHIKLALAEVRAGLDELTSLSGEVCGEVVIGAAPHARSSLLPRIAASIHGKHPKLTLNMRYDSYAALERALSARDVDFVIGSERGDPTSPNVVAVPLLSDHLDIVARADHPFTRVAQLQLAELLAADWVLPPDRVPLRRRFRDFLRCRGLTEPKPTFETGDCEIVKGMLLETDCIAFALGCESMHEVERGVLTLLPCPEPLAEFLRASVTLHLTYPAEVLRSPSQQIFCDEVMRVASELQQQQMESFPWRPHARGR